MQAGHRQFIQAAKEEIDGQTQNENWQIIPQDTVPEGAMVLPLVWAMQWKQCIS
jgi:hypothetical protein